VIGPLRRFYESLRGSGEYSVTVPPMDGALKPNNAMEEAPVLVEAPTPDNLAALGRRILFSSGAEVLESEDGAAKAFASFDRPVVSLAAHAGALAVGLADGRILVRGGPHDGKSVTTVSGRPTLCPTAIAFEGADSILLCLGSATNPATEWKRDLMERNASGSVWRVGLRDGAASCLADGLAWPYGVLATGGDVVVSESWRHRLLKLSGSAGAPEPVLSDLPAYPARLAAALGGGAWLALFAPRRQLIEFVLRERSYRTRMMQEVDPAYWVAPTLAPMHSFLEPLQGGTLKKLAKLKPWAPSRSYGLVVRLDAAWQPVASYHSRADGTRHGVASCLEADGRLLAASTGGNAIMSLGITA